MECASPTKTSSSFKSPSPLKFKSSLNSTQFSSPYKDASNYTQQSFFQCQSNSPYKGTDSNDSQIEQLNRMIKMVRFYHGEATKNKAIISQKQISIFVMKNKIEQMKNKQEKLKDNYFRSKEKIAKKSRAINLSKKMKGDHLNLSTSALKQQIGYLRSSLNILQSLKKGIINASLLEQNKSPVNFSTKSFVKKTAIRTYSSALSKSKNLSSTFSNLNNQNISKSGVKSSFYGSKHIKTEGEPQKPTVQRYAAKDAFSFRPHVDQSFQQNYQVQFSNSLSNMTINNPPQVANNMKSHQQIYNSNLIPSPTEYQYASTGYVDPQAENTYQINVKHLKRDNERPLHHKNNRPIHSSTQSANLNQGYTFGFNEPRQQPNLNYFDVDISDIDDAQIQKHKLRSYCLNQSTKTQKPKDLKKFNKNKQALQTSTVHVECPADYLQEEDFPSYSFLNSSAKSQNPNKSQQSSGDEHIVINRKEKKKNTRRFSQIQDSVKLFYFNKNK